MIKINIISSVVLVYLNGTNFSYLVHRHLVTEQSLMRFIAVHSRAPQEHEDKIVSTYKSKLKRPWIFIYLLSMRRFIAFRTSPSYAFSL